MPCNNVKRAVVSDSVHIPSMMYCVRVIFMYYLSHTRNFCFFYCIIIVIIIIIIIIIIIVIIIKHFHQLKTVIGTIRNLEWLNSIGCLILFWSILIFMLIPKISANYNVLLKIPSKAWVTDILTMIRKGNWRKNRQREISPFCELFCDLFYWKGQEFASSCYILFLYISVCNYCKTTGSILSESFMSYLDNIPFNSLEIINYLRALVKII